MHLVAFQHFYKGNNFCDFLFAFLHRKCLLKMGLLLKEIINCQVDLFRREAKQF